MGKKSQAGCHSYLNPQAVDMPKSNGEATVNADHIKFSEQTGPKHGPPAISTSAQTSLNVNCLHPSTRMDLPALLRLPRME